jgi:predicted phage baseplate assembly protein
MALPIPDLDDKRYSDLVAEGLARIPVAMPQWTDHNASDPGISFLELFAWLAEMQIYGLNYLRPEHYRKFLRLLGIRPRSAAPAATAVTFASASGWEGLIPAGTELSTAADPVRGEAAVAFETVSPLWMLDNGIAAIITAWGTGFQDNTEANARDGIFYHAFGENPTVGSALYVAFHKDLAAGRGVRLTVDLYAEDLPPLGRHRGETEAVIPSTVLTWEYSSAAGYRQLTLLEDTTLNLTRSGHILFATPDDLTAVTSPYLALTSPPTTRPFIRCMLTSGAWETPVRFDAVRLNSVSVVQRVRVRDEAVRSEEGEEAGNGMPGQALMLSRTPVLEGSLELRVTQGGDTEAWLLREDLDASQPDDRHFCLDPLTGTIRFGDGNHGMVLPVGAAVRADYLAGGGTLGNVKAGSITRVITAGLGDVTVANQWPATGGEDPETLQEVIQRAPLELKAVDRAITSADFEYLALNTPGLRVARAKALPLWQPGTSAETVTPALVTVVVVPWSYLPKPIPGAGFLRTVCNHLDQHRLITTRVQVVGPSYVLVSAHSRLQAAPGFSREDVQARAAARLLAYLHPLTGGDDGTGWSFGRAVYRSEVTAVIKEVPGVDCVMELTLTGGSGASADAGGNLLIAKDALVCSENHIVEVPTMPGSCAIQA